VSETTLHAAVSTTLPYLSLLNATVPIDSLRRAQLSSAFICCLSCTAAGAATEAWTRSSGQISLQESAQRLVMSKEQRSSFYKSSSLVVWLLLGAGLASFSLLKEHSSIITYPIAASDVKSVGTVSSASSTCAKWSRESLPDGLSLYDVYDSGWKSCGVSKNGSRLLPSLLSYTLERGASYNRSTALRSQVEGTSLFQQRVLDLRADPPKLNCSLVTPRASVLVSLGIWKLAHEEQIAACWNTKPTSFAQQQRPWVHVRHAPRENKAKNTKSILVTKDGLSSLLQKYDPGCRVQGSEYCMLPETYRLTDDKDECQHFFAMVSSDSASEKKWIRKSSKSFRGQGILLVEDVDKDLVEPFSNCSGSSNDVIVQRYIPPYQIENRGTYLKTWLLYKFGSVPNPTAQADPPQAWHIKVGANHICSEELSMLNDPEYGQYAFICSRHMWKSNPRIQALGGWKNQTEKYFKPFPTYWGETLKEDAYDTLMEQIDEQLANVAHVVDAYANEVRDYAGEGQSVWSLLGVDLIVDQNLKPWLIELNPCPGLNLNGANVTDVHRNPMIPAWRVILSHYQRFLLGKNTVDENQCSGDDHVTRLF